MRFPNARAASCALLTLALAGCSSMEGIDRRITRVLDDRSGAIGATPPRVDRESVRPATVAGDLYERDPTTNNPAASELTFTAADESRDVLARLQSFGSVTGEPRPIGIVGALRTAQESAREFVFAEEEYILAVIRLLIERHLWSPRFFNDTTFQSDFTSIDGRYTTALSVINELRATQRLPYGGDLEARFVTRAAQQLIDIAGDEYTQSAQLVLSADVPLLRDAGLIAQEELIQANREVIYAARTFERFRRALLVSIASDYFDLVAQLGVINNLKRQVFSFEELFRQREALVLEERIPQFESQNVRQRLLDAQASLESAREAYRLSLDRFKIRLGLPIGTNLVITPDALILPDPAISPEEAARLATVYRLDFQNDRDRVDDARRGVKNAQNQLLPDLDFFASATLNTDTGPGEEESSRPDFDLDDTDYRVGVTFGLPLDREIERLNLRTAQIGLFRDERDFDENRDQIILDARAAVREIERARNDLALRQLAVDINKRRLEELEIREDEIDTQDRIDAETDQLQLENALEDAKRSLRISILQYLLSTGQLRVNPDGTLNPLPGMDLRVEAVDDPELARPFN
ncbi:MAG: TolC family protein, partial [Planctomycetota bacterium]